MISDQKRDIKTDELRKINIYNNRYSEEKDLYDAIAKIPEVFRDFAYEIYRTKGTCLF